MILKTNLLFIAGLVLSLYSLAQQPMSFKEAIAYSLQHHGSNVIYNNKIELTKQQAKEALAAYLPQLGTTVSWDDNLKRQITIIPAGAFSPTDLKLQFGNKYNTTAVIQLDQTVYDQSLLYGLKANAPNQRIAELNKGKNDEDLIYNTASDYAQILILKEQLKLLGANEKEYQDVYDITEFRFDKGVAKKVDVEKAIVNLTNVQAKQKLVQSQIKVAYNTLKNTMGLSLDSALVIEDTLEYSQYMQIPDEDVNVANRIDYQLQQQNVTLQQIDVKRKQAAFLPTVSAYARYGETAFSNDIGKSFGDWFNYSAVGVKVNVPLFSGGRKTSQLKQSRIELDNANQQLALDKQSLQLEFQNANSQLLETITNLNTNKNNMELAKKIYQTSQFEYQKGVSTMNDLLTSDYSYKETQSNYLNSLLNLIGTRLAYEKAKGTIKSFINQL